MARIIDSDFLHRALQHFMATAAFAQGRKKL